MTDKKLTDKEIKKALEKEIHLAEYVDSDYCSNTEVSLIKSTIDLINRQKAEIERLNKENDILSKNADTAFQDGLNEAQELYAEQIKNEVKAEARKEFAERLKEILGVKKFGLIDNLLKEMDGE